MFHVKRSGLDMCEVGLANLAVTSEDVSRETRDDLYASQ